MTHLPGERQKVPKREKEAMQETAPAGRQAMLGAAGQMKVRLLAEAQKELAQGSPEEGRKYHAPAAAAGGIRNECD